MIVGVEGIHTWATGLVLNDRSAMPHYHVRRIPGLIQKPDFEPEADAAIGRLGEIARYSDQRGKTIAYEGDVVANSLAGLVSARGSLLAAFSGTSELRMDAAAHPTYTPGDLPARYFFARPLAAEVEEEQRRGPNRQRSFGYEREFTLSLRLSDPRYYHTVGAVNQTDNTAVPIGGAGVPFTPGDSSAGPSSLGFEIIANNPGNAYVDAIFDMAGPQINPVISNETLGLFLRFKDLSIGVGEYVEVDFRRRTAIRGSGENVRHKIDPSSTWWDRGARCIDAGANTIRQRAYGIGIGAAFQLRFTPADFA